MFFDLKGMSKDQVAYLILFPLYQEKRDAKLSFFESDSAFSNILSKLNVLLSMRPKDAVVLFLSRCYTENGIKHVRAYIGGGLPLVAIRAEKCVFLRSMPQMKILRTSSSEWENLPAGRFMVLGTTGRYVVCVRISIVEAVNVQLQQLHEA